MVPELIFVERIEPESKSYAAAKASEIAVLSLPFERRQIARQRVILSDGSEAGLKLPRGTVLREGHLLQSEDGRCVRVQGAPEQVSLVRCDSPRVLAQAAYHLGNRHVWVQVGDGWLRYLHDHVLDEMLVGLGIDVEQEQAPFEPEAGAYSSAGSHSHGSVHEH